MANSRVQAPPINLKERIAALEQRNAAPSSRSASPIPSGIPQLATNNALRDKIAKFEKKGGIPVPRGRFGMGAPPADNKKPRKQGELYGNRIPRAVSGGVAALAGSHPDRRSMSLSVNRLGYDSSSSFGSRSASPCPSDYDGMSDGVLSPSKTNIDLMEDLTSPVQESMEEPLSPHSEVSSYLETTHSNEETSEIVPEVIVTSLSPDDEDKSTEVIGTAHQPNTENGNQLSAAVEYSPTHEEQEDWQECLDEVSPSPKQEDSQPIDATISSSKLGESQSLSSAFSSPKPEEVEPLSTAIPSPKLEEVEPLSPAFSSPKLEEIELLSPAILSPKVEEVEPLSPAILSPKLEEVESLSPTILSPKLGEVEPFSPATLFPKLGEVEPFSPAILSPKLAEVEPLSLAIPSPQLEEALPLSPVTSSLREIQPSTTALLSPKLVDSRPLSPTTSSPELGDERPISPVLPSPEPQGANVSSPTISSPGLAGASPFSAAFPSPGRAGASPLGVSFPSPRPTVDLTLGSATPSPKLKPISATIPSPKLEDIRHFSTAIPSPRSAKSDKPFSPTISSPKPEADQSLEAVSPSPKLVQPFDTTVPSPEPKEDVRSPRGIATLEDEKRRSTYDVPVLSCPAVGDTAQLANIEDKIAHSGETQDTEASSVSRSSSLRTLTPTSHAPPVLDDELEPLTKINVPVISLSPPATESIPSPSLSTPRELLSPQESERAVSPISAGISSPSIPITPPSPQLRSPDETRSQITSPVESTGSNPSSARPAIWRHSSADERLCNFSSPVSGGSEGAFIRSPLSADSLYDPSLADQLSDQILQMLVPKGESLGPGVALTSPPPELSPESPLARLAYDLPDDRRATIASPSYFSKSSLAPTDMLSPAAGTPPDMLSPLSSGDVISPGEIVTAQRIATSTVRGVPVFIPRRQVDYSHFPPTPDVRNTEFRGSLPAFSPTSPTSRFRHPLPSAGRSNTFHAIVRGKVKESDSAIPSFSSLGVPEVPKSRQSNTLSPNTRELASLLQDAALLEHALTQGALFDESRSSEENSELAESSGRSEEQETDKEDEKRLRRHATLILPGSGKEGDSKNPTFRLPLRKKTKHWKASSTNVALKGDLPSRPSLEAERSAYSASLPMIPALLKDEENRSKTPDGLKPLPRTPRPRLISGLKKLAGTGSTRSLNMPVAYPRHSASTSSEQSSEDSMPVATPPDPSVDYDGAGSSKVAWPSVSPKRSGMKRAASFAEKIWNRARTKSSGSTLSANDSRAEFQHEPMPTQTSSASIMTASSSMSSEDLSSSRPSSRATYKLDVLPPSEPLFDAQSYDGNDILSPSTLPNPYSPGSSSIGSPSNNVLSPPISVLTNPHSLVDNDSWISEPTDLFDAFPSVPQAVLSTQAAPKTSKPLPSINVAGVFDSNPLGPQSASLPKRNTTISHLTAVPHTAAADGGFLGRASTMPRQHPSVDSYPHRF